MRLHINHVTHYRYTAPVSYALQQVRLTPKARGGQKIIEWNVVADGARHQLSFADQHANHVDLFSIDTGGREIILRCSGIVEVSSGDGVIGVHGGYLPLWYFSGATALTQVGRCVRALAKQVRDAHDNSEDGGGDIGRLHNLSALVRGAVRWETGHTGSGTTAEQALTIGSGVCQDHAHVFCAAARLLGYPARYVSGYLLIDGRVDQDATHGWAEAHVAGLGWVGFDVSNGISPDDRYVRVATGLDYREAAPVTGMHFGGQGEEMLVTVQVQQQ